MTNYQHIVTMPKKSIHALMVFLWIVVSASAVWGHGPEGHRNASFTAFEAAKKGLQLYDRLLESGKLAESWETGLTDIKVFTRDNNKKKEIVVQFVRTMGEPRSVYIFFSEKGEYSGSNFTGE